MDLRDGASGLDLQRGSYQAGLTIIAYNDSRNCRLRHVDDAVEPGLARGFSIEDRNSCRFDDAGDRVRLDPLVDAVLQNNGGPTWTHALQDGSPAIESVEPADADPVLVTCQPEFITGIGFIVVDQRGVLRPQSARCDGGACEKSTLTWLTHCCLDLWLGASQSVSSAREASADFRELMVKEQLQDGIVLAARILTAIDIVAKAVRDFGAAQGPEAARQVLEPAQPQFAVIQQSLAALAGCCGSTLDRDAGRLRVETTVERASAAFLELKAAVQSPNPGG